MCQTYVVRTHREYELIILDPLSALGAHRCIRDGVDLLLAQCDARRVEKGHVLVLGVCAGHVRGLHEHAQHRRRKLKILLLVEQNHIVTGTRLEVVSESHA